MVPSSDDDARRPAPARAGLPAFAVTIGEIRQYAPGIALSAFALHVGRYRLLDS
ncbi:hypothetical protein [Streptomyces misionensis]|uniref:hypothetical protein n=1 Tax=Streptomyces misionensis TaxID=67331 RepID=UPI000A97860D|nr:hypothetical protein [Streptomyces misionensis]